MMKPGEPGTGDENPRCNADKPGPQNGSNRESGHEHEDGHEDSSGHDYRDADEYVYVRAQSFDGAERKKPIPKWVSDCPAGVDPRTLDNPHADAYHETNPKKPYIIVGAVEGYVLDIDVDVGDDHNEVYGGDIADIRMPDGTLGFRTPSGGLHILLKFDRDHAGIEGVEGVDIQGDMDGNHGVAASPFHHPEYGIVTEPVERVTFDTVLETETDSLGRKPTLNKGFDAELLAQETPAERSVADRVAIGEFEPPEEGPEERPACYHAALTARQTGSADCNNHDTNVAIGALGLAAGYSVEDIIADIRALDADTVKFDYKETEYGLKHLRSGGYSPPATETLADAGIIDAPGCEPTCPIHVPGVGDKKRSTNAPGDDDGYEKMPTWALRNVAYDAGHNPDDDVWRDITTGRAIAETAEAAAEINDETDATVYRALPVSVHNLVLDILEEHGRGDEHGRKRRKLIDDLPIHETGPRR